MLVQLLSGPSIKPGHVTDGKKREILMHFNIFVLYIS